MGRGYEIALTSQTRYTFTGYPGSMIEFREGFGSPTQFIQSLNAEVQGGVVRLTWNSTENATKYLIFRSNQRIGLHDPSVILVARTPGGATGWTDVNVSVQSEFYYFVKPVDFLGNNGSSTYSVGVFFANYRAGSDTFALPLKQIESHSLDWYCDSIPDVVGMSYLVHQVWKFHAKEMPERTYDSPVMQAEGYQISVDGYPAEFSFVGR